MNMTVTKSELGCARTTKRTVMLVDDEQLLTDMVSESLIGNGYTTVTFNDSDSAIRFYETEFQHVDLVILDMVMPDIDGKATFAALKRINPNVKVLLSSGYFAGQETEELLAAGAVGFLQKPFKLSELVLRVAAL